MSGDRDRLTCDRVLAFALSHPWALTDDMCHVLASIFVQRIAGHATEPDAIEAAIAQRRTVTAATDGIVVIPMHGVIAPRMNMFSDISGGTTFEALTDSVNAAVAQSPRAIILDIDSPGGNVAGAHEFAETVLAARAKVPVIAQANHLMGSAVYWTGSAATQIVASPSSLIGSIGVYALYEDISAQLEQRGIKRELIAAGEFKGEGADGGPLSDDARAHRKSVIEGFAAEFMADVARGRGVEVATVRDTYSKGRVWRAPQALAAGMVNRIGTLTDTIHRLGGTVTAGSLAPAPTPLRATAQEPSPATAQEPVTIAMQHEHTRLRLAAGLYI